MSESSDSLIQGCPASSRPLEGTQARLAQGTQAKKARLVTRARPGQGVWRPVPGLSFPPRVGSQAAPSCPRPSFSGPEQPPSRGKRVQSACEQRSECCHPRGPTRSWSVTARAVSWTHGSAGHPRLCFCPPAPDRQQARGDPLRHGQLPGLQRGKEQQGQATVSPNTDAG